MTEIITNEEFTAKTK